VTFKLFLSQKYVSAEMRKFADIEEKIIQLGLCGLCAEQNDLSVHFSIRTRYNYYLSASVYYGEDVLKHT
jgi:hypothetical protein